MVGGVTALVPSVIEPCRKVKSSCDALATYEGAATVDDPPDGEARHDEAGEHGADHAGHERDGEALDGPGAERVEDHADQERRDLAVGDGRVIAYNFNPLHRDFNHADHRFLWYALVAVIGVCLGIVVSSGLGAAIPNIFSNVVPVTLAVFLVLALVIFAAAYLPTRKVVALEPGDALRYE